MVWPRFEVKDSIRSGSLFVMLMGLGSLLAWLFQWRTVLQLAPAPAFMSCDTAGCLLLTGLAFFFTLRNSWRASRVLGFVLFLLGSLYLWASLQQTWFSFHALFPEATTRLIAPIPLMTCQPSAATAAAFLQLGAFFLLMNQPWLERYGLPFAAVLATATPAIGVLGGLLTFAGIADQDSRMGHLARMSGLSALCVFVAGLVPAACSG